LAKASRDVAPIPQVADTNKKNTDRQFALIKQVGLSPTLHGRTASLIFITDSEPQAHAPGMSVTISFDASSGKATLGRNPVDDPSTIYTKLPVRKPVDIGNVPKLDYYPTYSGLTPEQRWVYLNWLGDISKEVEIGYVFIYYYGLERHLVIGDYDDACDEIALLRKHHSNNSFQAYSRSAILHACLLRNRQDRLEHIYKNDPPIEYENADLLIAFKSNSDLSPESLLRVSPRIRGINRKYIRSHPEQYLQAIHDVLILKYEQPLFPFASRYKIDDLPKKQEIVFANISFPGELRAPEFPNFYDYTPFVTELSSIYGEAHLVTKQMLAEKRKRKPNQAL
jgi:hypothetical protein